MNSYVITCTSTVDLDRETMQERNIPYIRFRIAVNGKEYDDDFFSTYPYESFYEDMANGIKPVTSQIGYGRYLEFFESFLKEGKDVIHIDLSSVLSSDYATCEAVVRELNEKYENKVTLIDSLGASSGYGMLVLKAKDNLDAGMACEDNVRFLEEYRRHIHYLFTSTDLASMLRGGRLRKAAGILGSALKICPLMCIASDGSPGVMEIIRTKSRALKRIHERMLELIEDRNYRDRIFISHSMDEEDALKLKRMTEESFPDADVRIWRIGTGVGSHTGPGTIALFFAGKERDYSSFSMM